MKKYITSTLSLILLLLISGCTNINYSEIYPEPPSSGQLLEEKQDNELADPFPTQKLKIDGVTIN